MTKTGAGMLVLNGANAYTGGTTVSGGSLVGDVTSLQGDILNDATLVFNQLSDATFTGNLSGSGVLVKAGGATLTLGGSNTQTGGTVIQGGALVANSANLFGPVLNNGSLVFNQNAAGVFGGSITGSGSLTKSGAGTLTLDGFNSLQRRHVHHRRHAGRLDAEPAGIDRQRRAAACSRRTSTACSTGRSAVSDRSSRTAPARSS